MPARTRAPLFLQYGESFRGIGRYLPRIIRTKFQNGKPQGKPISMNSTIIIPNSQKKATLDSCPSELKQTILRLLTNDCFIEAKELLDQWQQQDLK